MSFFHYKADLNAIKIHQNDQKCSDHGEMLKFSLQTSLQDSLKVLMSQLSSQSLQLCPQHA